MAGVVGVTVLLKRAGVTILSGSSSDTDDDHGHSRPQPVDVTVWTTVLVPPFQLPPWVQRWWYILIPSQVLTPIVHGGGLHELLSGSGLAGPLADLFTKK